MRKSGLIPFPLLLTTILAMCTPLSLLFKPISCISCWMIIESHLIVRISKMPSYGLHLWDCQAETVRYSKCHFRPSNMVIRPLETTRCATFTFCWWNQDNTCLNHIATSDTGFHTCILATLLPAGFCRESFELNMNRKQRYFQLGTPVGTLYSNFQAQV